uniref:Granulin n=1 Tax=Fundulus heteroclitus TaxID=8078 RepID=A0A146Z5L6_FUNHE
MPGITLWLCAGAFLWGSALCDIKCPDGTPCADLSTCCQTAQGYGCCPYPKAVCCADHSHCCPSGYSCNLAAQTCVKQSQPWISIPMAKKVTAEAPSSPALSLIPSEEVKNNDNNNNYVPDQIKSTVVHCDNYYVCPDGTTCCRHPAGAWFCCIYSPGRCCLDGYHCCPYGYDCDFTYTHCIRGGLRYPFYYKPALSSVPASQLSASQDGGGLQEAVQMALTETGGSSFEQGASRCDDKFFCPKGSRCCKGPDAQWSCCPN